MAKSNSVSNNASRIEELKNRPRTRSVAKLLQKHKEMSLNKANNKRKNRFTSEYKIRISELETKIQTRGVTRLIQEYTRMLNEESRSTIIKKSLEIRMAVIPYRQMELVTQLFCYIRENCDNLLNTDKNFRRVFVNKLVEFDEMSKHSLYMKHPHTYEYREIVINFIAEINNCKEFYENLFA